MDVRDVKEDVYGGMVDVPMMSTSTLTGSIAAWAVLLLTFFVLPFSSFELRLNLICMDVIVAEYKTSTRTVRVGDQRRGGEGIQMAPRRERAPRGGYPARHCRYEDEDGCHGGKDGCCQHTDGGHVQGTVKQGDFKFVGNNGGGSGSESQGNQHTA